MKNNFAAVLDRHEKEDLKLAMSEKDITEAVKREFANADELLGKAAELSLSVTDVFGKDTDLLHFPVLPVRKTDGFHMHRHTTSQVPYFHKHEFYEIVYVCRGTCVQLFPERDKLTLGSGRLCILSPGSVHAIERCKKSDVIIKIDIPRSDMDAALAALNATLGEQTVCDVGDSAEYLIYKLTEEYVRADEFSAAALRCYTELLVAELLRTSAKPYVAAENTVADYLEKNIGHADLKGLSAALGFSEAYTSRFIKERTGKNFTDLLGQFRLGKAEELLRTTEMPIESIAAAVGYLNATGLYKKFRASYGMTPGAYRRQFS